MKRVLLLASLAILLAPGSVDGQAQGQSAPTLQTIEACRTSLTEAGRAASFQGTAVYEVLSDSNGNVLEVRPVKVSEVFNIFVDAAEFRGCVQRWKLSGAGATVVAFNAGTTGELLKAWKISVTSGTSALRLLLPRTFDR